MKYIISIIVTLLFFGISPLYAEELAYDPQGAWWLNLGLGAGQVSTDTDIGDDQVGASATAAFNYALFEHNFIEIRASETNDRFVSLGSYNDKKVDSVFDVGLLYGAMKKTEHMMVGASAGLAYTQIHFSNKTSVYDPVTHAFNTTYNTSRVHTIGFPLEFQAYYKPFRYVGFGITGLANLNTEAPVLSLLLGLQFGNK